MIASTAEKSQSPWQWPKRTTRRSVVSRCLALTLVVLAAYPLIGYLASRQGGQPAWLAAAIAAVVCWLGAELALLLAAWPKGPQAVLNCLMLSIAFRTLLPLVVAVALSRYSPSLADAGIFGCMVAFYLLTLVAETLLALPLIQSKQPSSGAQ